MARTPLTPQQRAAKVLTAAANLTDLVDRAEACAKSFGPSDARTLSAWAEVEDQGAVVHRQARLLAGKSRGG